MMGGVVYYIEYKDYVDLTQDPREGSLRMRLRFLLILAVASITCAFVTIAAAADLAQVSPSNQRPVTPPKSTPTAAPASPPAPAPPAAPSAALINTGPGDYTIGIDDLLHVIVWENKELEQD